MTFNRSLFFTTVGLLFAVLFVPLIVSNTLFFPYITGKNFTFRIIVELAGLSWVILMLRDKSYRPKFSWLSVAIAVFVGIVFVADIFASNPVKAFLSNFERMEGWITLIHLFVYYLVTVSVMSTWTYWRTFFQVSLGVSAIVCIQGFMQAADPASQSGPRIYASLGNATYLAVYMLFHIFIAIILLVRHLKDKKDQNERDTVPWYLDWVAYVYLVLIIVQSIILFLTATRGSILGLIGGLIVTAIFVAITERKNKSLRKISIGILIAIVAVVGLFFLVKDSSFAKKDVTLSRLASISATDNTTKSRFMIWGMAIKGVTQDPKHFVIGWGQEGFNYIFNQYYNPGMYGQEQWFDRSHNVVFDWLTQAGVLGLLSYLLIFGFATYTIWRKSNFSHLEKGLLTGLLAGYFFHNLFVFDNIVSYVLFFMILAYIHSAIDRPKAEPQPKNHTKKQADDEGYSEALQYVGVILAGIVFVYVCYQYDYKPIAANNALMTALQQTRGSAANTSLYTNANIDSFKEAVSYNTIGLYETREQLMSVAQGSLSNQTEDSVKQGLVTLAQSELSRQLVETPNDARYYVLGGSFFQNIGDNKDALTLLTKAAELSPKKQTILFSLGSSYYADKKYTEALATFKQAYELDTSFPEAKKLYGLVAAYVGQDVITNTLLGPGPIMDARFLAAYKATKKYDLMIAYLEKNLAQKPTDIQAEVALAAGYMTIGNVTKTIAALKTAKTLTTDAGVLTQIDAMIKDIQAGKNPFETTP